MNGPSVVMHRQPVAAVAFDLGSIASRSVLVICNDGAVFELDDAGPSVVWREVEPVPGTERVAVRQAEMRCTWKVGDGRHSRTRQCVLETGHDGEHEYEPA